MQFMVRVEAHEKPYYIEHFQYFVVNDNNEIMVQQRPLKISSPGLWTNTCCSHQRKVRLILEGKGRLMEEFTQISRVVQFHIYHL
jgi:isopentenyl-diphosphate delta-isomerase